jgi:hypothetical protein
LSKLDDIAEASGRTRIKLSDDTLGFAVILSQFGHVADRQTDRQMNISIDTL